MKLEIEMPEPQFRVGDEVRRPNEHNDGAFLYRITVVTFGGTWWWSAEHGARYTITDGHYLCKPLPGSVYNNAAAAPYLDTDGPDTHNIHSITIADMEQRVAIHYDMHDMYLTQVWRPDPVRAATLIRRPAATEQGRLRAGKE